MEAKQGFQQLIKLDPQNEDFSSWYKSTKRSILHIIVNYIMFGSLGLMFLTITIPAYLPISIPKVFNQTFEGIFILTFAFNIIEWLVRRK